MDPISGPSNPSNPSVVPVAKKSVLPVILIVLLILTLIGTAGYFYWQNLELKKQIIRPLQTQISPVIEPSPTLDSTSDRLSDEQSPTPGTTNQSMSIQYTPHADWQTYTDEVAGFSLQYSTTPTQPYNSHESLGTNQPGQGVTIMGCHTPPAGPSTGQEVCLKSYSATVYTNYAGGSRREWMTQNIKNSSSCQRYYADLLIADKNALVATSNCSSWGETYVLIPSGSQMIVFFFEGYSRNDATNEITLADGLRKILSTFKFLD